LTKGMTIPREGFLSDHQSELRLAVDRRRVAHETIDGEVILIQLETGYYYSLDGLGAQVWTGLVDGREPDALVGELSASLGDDARAAVFGLLHELHSEQLVVLEHGAPAALAEAALAGGSDGIARPALQKYTDMEDFMLVDPVHDVDERGWPNRAAGTG
jgi:hypothetical protein